MDLFIKSDFKNIMWNTPFGVFAQYSGRRFAFAVWLVQFSATCGARMVNVKGMNCAVIITNSLTSALYH